MQICNFNGSRSNYVQIRVFPSQFTDFYKFVKERFQAEFPGESAFDMFYKKKNEETHILVSNQISYNQALVDFTLKKFTRLYYSPTNLNESVRPFSVRAEKIENNEAFREAKQHFIEKIGAKIETSQVMVEEGSNKNSKSGDKPKEEPAKKILPNLERCVSETFLEESNKNEKEMENSKKQESNQQKNSQKKEEIFLDRKDFNKKPINYSFGIAEEEKSDENLMTYAKEKSRKKIEENEESEPEKIIWEVINEEIPSIVNEIMGKIENNKKNKREKIDELSESFFGGGLSNFFYFFL